MALPGWAQIASVHFANRRIAGLAINEQRDAPNITAVKEAADHAGVELIALYAAKSDDYAPAFAAMRNA